YQRGPATANRLSRRHPRLGQRGLLERRLGVGSRDQVRPRQAAAAGSPGGILAPTARGPPHRSVGRRGRRLPSPGRAAAAARAPFDRLLIAQALQHGMTLATVDDALRAYPVPLLPMA